MDVGAFVSVRGEVRLLQMSDVGMGMSIGEARLIAGTAPGVLFLVSRRCNRGVCFSTLLAVGFRAFMIGGAFVMRGMVRMGVSSITLCLRILTLCSSAI